jgi:broad specificity phosphatase PhoE
MSLSRRWIPTLIGTILCLLVLSPALHAQTTVVILVRHAEREDASTAAGGMGGSQDPGLNAAGQARARALVDVVRDAGLVAIYHTQYRRTRDTAAPAAAALHIQTTEIGPKPGEAASAHAAAVAADILAHHEGGTILVVGHSNTVPLIAAALGVKDPPAIAETEYDRVYTVVKKGDQPGRLILTRYGS